MRVMRTGCRAVLWLVLAWIGPTGTPARGEEHNPRPDALRARLDRLEGRGEQLDALSAEMAQLRGELRAIASGRFADIEHCDRLPPVSAAHRANGGVPGRFIGYQNDRHDPWASEPAATAIAAPPLPAAGHSASGGGYGDGYSGLQIGFWGWLSYLASPQQDLSTFWAWEAELDITKSFTEHLAASADLEFVDSNSGARVQLEQLFLSFLLPGLGDGIFTAGKFNAPFGIERRDFWDRSTASTSPLFRAMPRDMTGLMLTQPWCDTDVTIRTFVVNGFDDNLDVNQQPSLGVMAQYRPSDDFSLAVTNWWGPELVANNHDQLYLTVAQADCHVFWDLFLSGEFLYATTESPTGRLEWSGYTVIARQPLTDRWGVFGLWSYLEDRDGYVTGVSSRHRQYSFGLSWFLHEHVEARAEYRRDLMDTLAGAGAGRAEFDHVSAHLTFGY